MLFCLLFMPFLHTHTADGHRENSKKKKKEINQQKYNCFCIEPKIIPCVHVISTYLYALFLLNDTYKISLCCFENIIFFSVISFKHLFKFCRNFFFLTQCFWVLFFVNTEKFNCLKNKACLWKQKKTLNFRIFFNERSNH